MTQSYQHGEIRSRLKEHGLTEVDLNWLDGLAWSDAAIPPIGTSREAADYMRREKALNSSVSALLLLERVESIEGKLAASIGAALANWKEHGEED